MTFCEKKAVVLLSGGLDSTTTLAIALSEGFECHCLSFAYGQRHLNELEAARDIARSFHVKNHLILRLDIGHIGGSALTGAIDVPKQRNLLEIQTGIPVTYVPARNTIFLSCALAWAEALSAPHIFIGVNAIDYSGYPDCRPEFISAFEKMANLAVKAAVEGKMPILIRTPLIHMTKADIIRTGIRLGVDYSLTHSCYDPSPDGSACGQCDSCLLRLRGFEEAGIPDPIKYATL
ncbi:MAG: 7-cyano-7-deazaguanine synthase QueC [Desulfobacterales bacterium]|jgi:7-cyano-7-deazaguanine synthase|nr:7-cyano-7-deazaguanine synthase QueC [Desulfobacterales bacterium]